MPMHIAGDELNFTYNALEIYVSGCTRNCKGCHNPELQKYGVGKKWQRWLRDNGHHITNQYEGLIDKIWIVGGDLLCQPMEDAVEFVKGLRKLNPHIQIVVWTGAEDIDGVDDTLFELVDGFKTGSYQKNRKSYEADYLDPKLGWTTVKLASSNQCFQFKLEGEV